jgi:hypothetical protein
VPAATLAAFGLLLRDAIGDDDFALLYAPFERLIPQISLA